MWKCREKAPKIRLLVGVCLALSLCGFKNCSRSMQSVCAREIPQFIADLADAKAWASALETPAKGRTIASDTFERERREWKRWVERKLSQARDFMEFAEDRNAKPADIEKIHRLSNELVNFWGHLEKGKTQLYYRSISSIEARGLEMKESLCAQHRKK